MCDAALLRASVALLRIKVRKGVLNGGCGGAFVPRGPYIVISALLLRASVALLCLKVRKGVLTLWGLRWRFCASWTLYLGVPDRLGRLAGAASPVGGWNSNFASLSGVRSVWLKPSILIWWVCWALRMPGRCCVLDLALGLHTRSTPGMGRDRSRSHLTNQRRAQHFVWQRCSR